MFRPTTLQATTGDGKENFNLEDFVGSLPTKLVGADPYDVNKLVPGAILEGLISGDCIMSTGVVYPPLAITEPPFIPYHPSTLPYSDFSHIPCCLPMEPLVMDNWHSVHGLYPSTLPLLEHKDPALVSQLLRSKRPPLESKITWSGAYMDYNYSNTAPSMTVAGAMNPHRPYSYPRAMSYPRTAFHPQEPEIYPRVFGDCTPGVLPTRFHPPITTTANPPPEIIQHSGSVPMSSKQKTPIFHANDPVRPAPPFIKYENKKKPFACRFVQTKVKKNARIKNTKLVKCKKVPSRAEKLVLSLTKPLLDCHRKSLDNIARNIPIEPDSTMKKSPERESSRSSLDYTIHELLSVAMLTKCLHQENSKRNPLCPRKRYAVQCNS